MRLQKQMSRHAPVCQIIASDGSGGLFGLVAEIEAGAKCA
jgi:hypothetical protein